MQSKKKKLSKAGMSGLITLGTGSIVFVVDISDISCNGNGLALVCFLLPVVAFNESKAFTFNTEGARANCTKRIMESKRMIYQYTYIRLRQHNRCKICFFCFTVLNHFHNAKHTHATLKSQRLTNEKMQYKYVCVPEE